MIPKDLIGKTCLHPVLVEVFVDGIAPRSRTMMEVTVTHKGNGWNDRKNAYTGFKNSVGWMRGENRQYLERDVVHIDDLKPMV